MPAAAAQLPRIADRLGRRHGTVDSASAAGISVVWDDGFTVSYTTAKVADHVAAGLWLFTLPEASS